ncbi:hypothetical protein MVEN_01111600 [Mycena venus]|uniref:Uncharacterized protein n=1 Tax=Mycena venus TaxID=2733690 RepID=A0A8H7D0I6_9AGAR|nr:hypothetical protein MVEN_01111600 [Mycena venus]
MSSSARKDLFEVIAIHRVPAHLPKEEFEGKLEALIDQLLLLPIFKQNILKLQILLQNDRFDEYLESYECPPREPLAVVKVQAETIDNIMAIMNDLEVQKMVKRAEDFGLPSATCAFGIDVERTMDRVSCVEAADRVHLVCIYKVPENISAEEYSRGFESFTETFPGVPTIQENFVKFEKWLPNNVLDDHLHGVGYSRPDPTFLLHVEFESWENVIAFQNADSRKPVLAANRDFNLNTRACGFTADLVTKHERV